MSPNAPDFVQNSVPLEDGMDDAAAFAVPDIDASTAGHDEASPFVSKAFSGKDLASQDFDVR